MRAETKRNEKIVDQHNQDKVKYSFGNLALMYKISKSSISEIYWREMAKRGDINALSQGVIKRKYPYLITRFEDSKKLSTKKLK